MTTLDVTVAFPSGEMWYKHFGLSLTMLAIACLQKPVQGYDKTNLKLINQNGSILPKSRQELVQKAIAAGSTHLLFIDSDQEFPAWTLHALARHGKLCVAANIAIKNKPSVPTARNKSKTWPGGDVVYTRPSSTGLEQVWRIGCGIMLLNLDMFRDQPLPWFETTWAPEIKDFRGEDWYLCDWLEKKGVPIFIDHDLSKEVYHIGPYRYGHGDVEEKRIQMTDKEGRTLSERREQRLNPLCMIDT